MRSSLITWLLGLTCVLGAVPALADSVEEYRLRAAVLFNISRFVTWPESGSTLNLCVAGVPEMLRELMPYAGRSVQGREVRVRRVETAAEVHGCHALYLDTPTRQSVLLAAAHRSGALTVAETPAIFDADGAVYMGIADKRIFFEISQSAAQRNGLSISSKLLRLAREVY